MSNELLFGLYIFVLAGFLGHYVIEKVPPLLHTPLMAGTNAISGISLVGMVLGFIAVICATINTVGGFLITDRMLRMFRKKTPGGAKAGGPRA
jgi:NAD(P) transhydrogenase subunit alpha